MKQPAQEHANACCARWQFVAEEARARMTSPRLLCMAVAGAGTPQTIRPIEAAVHYACTLVVYVQAEMRKRMQPSVMYSCTTGGHQTSRQGSIRDAGPYSPRMHAHAREEKVCAPMTAPAICAMNMERGLLIVMCPVLKSCSQASTAIKRLAPRRAQPWSAWHSACHRQLQKSSTPGDSSCQLAGDACEHAAHA